jgi:hypothetical protein
MLTYISKGEMYVEVPPKKLLCIFHEKNEGLTAFTLREKEGCQLKWSFEHLFQKLPEERLKDWVVIKTILPTNEFYSMFKMRFEEELGQELDVNEPLYCFQFTFIPHLNESNLTESQCVFLLRRYKRAKCFVKFQQIN